MSLNRSEQMLSDYVARNPEELRFWQDKVRSVAQAERDEPAAAARLAEELWRYFEERATVVSPFKDAPDRFGLGPTSMRNLAEYWLRLWVEPRPKKRSAGQPYA